MLKILLVKMSSIGDLVHNLAMVSDIQTHFADAQIDWIAEEACVEIPAMHDAVANVIPFALRRWRKERNRAAWREFLAFRQRLQQERYDFVLDNMASLKSVAVCKLARGPSFGPDWKSAREAPAGLFYDFPLRISRRLHAVERYRFLAAAALGYRLDTPLNYGLAGKFTPLATMPTLPYAVFLHATSRSEKLWAENNWIAVGQYLAAQGIVCVLPWGTEKERQRSERLSQAIGNAVVPPRMNLHEAMSMLAHAKLALGVDTGLAHMAAALHKPVLGIFCDSDPITAGVYTPAPSGNLGHKGAPPSAAAVLHMLQREILPRI